MVYDKNSKKAIKLHEKLRGKIIVTGKIRNLKSDEIKLIYTLLELQQSARRYAGIRKKSTTLHPRETT